MRGKAKGRWVTAAIENMLVSNQAAAECIFRYGATACTDVTGFGLLGHLVEMARPSGVDVCVELETLPVLDGALETLRAGVFSSLQPQNVRLRRAVRNVDEASRYERYPILFDPQTAGGLLASVPTGRATACVDELKANGYPAAAVMGRTESQGSVLEPIRLVASTPTK